MSDSGIRMRPVAIMQSEADVAAIFLNLEALRDAGVDTKALTSLDYDIRFRTSDGEELYIDRELAKRSSLVRERLANIHLTSASNGFSVIQAPPREAALKKIITWFNYHNHHCYTYYKEGREPSPFNPSDEKYNHWQRGFLKVEDALLCEIFAAATYFKMDDLILAAKRRVARLHDPELDLDL